MNSPLLVKIELPVLNLWLIGDGVCWRWHGGTCQTTHTHNALLFSYLLIQTIWAFYGNLWAKGDHLMETSYLKAHPFGNRYLEWKPNLSSDRGQDSNPCG